MTSRRPTVGLCIIVKNEAATLPRLAASVADQIDHWTIVDTGSTDATIDVARRLFAAVPGEVIEGEWLGFGPSRNVALRAAEAHADWVLLLDADHTFHGEIDRSALADDLDAVAIEERYDGLRYWLPRLVRSGRGWAYHRRTHEYLARPDGAEVRQERTTSCWVEHHGDGGNRADKFERDLRLLGEDWVDHPDDARTAFYLARTYDDLGRRQEAIEWYRRRIALGGWEEERFYARWRIGALLLLEGRPDEGAGVLWGAWGERPWRAEPLVSLAEHYRLLGLWAPAWEACRLGFERCGAQPDGRRPEREPDALFVDAAAVEWRIAYEASIAAWYIGQRGAGQRLTAYLLTLPGLPDEIRRSVEANAGYYNDAPATTTED